ncbi:MAG: L-aspartate oxidase [Thermoleophilaceae bacterium]|nr:L-aspartate oxidase [Thermoleophilaceae bacterium]
MTPASHIDTVDGDVAVIGAGAAGLYAAVVAAAAGARVVLVSSSPLAQSASYWAQGGIAAALAADDSVELHLRDTLKAGRALSRESAARVLCADSPLRVRHLLELGVSFDADRHGALALGLEGGHSRRRVVHAGGSATGRRITRDLSALAALDENIRVLERTSATSLASIDGCCIGVHARDADGREFAVRARGTILATGGAAALWARTTNPPGVVGAGMTLALAAGAALADMEFQQFHPTALVSTDGHDGFLITEAIRGEGALLLNGDGDRFVEELAPRDEVALAIQDQLRTHPVANAPRPAVHLDMRSIDPTRFPNIVSALEDVGIDTRRDLIPVAPAAHYTMGGIATDLDGRSTLPGLYAVGECACTGLHGANRLASNSLAECVVFASRAALATLDEPSSEVDFPRPRPAPQIVPAQSTRDALWRLAGIKRDARGLEQLLDDPFPLARVIATCALAREESRGAHQRRDHPRQDQSLDRTHAVVRGGDPPLFERWT